ncbi:hypothetical protein SH661x_002903 [Planctomicrobium sp. SH661]|uniref:hypothetical protein n=1 Tax=Planctomicrobium sp. SH661 TaxID=3448124 RepID=UPI003F5BDC56
MFERLTDIVIALIVILGLGMFTSRLYREWQDSQRPRVVPDISGIVEQSLFGQPTLVIVISHQYVGNLKNGIVLITAKGDLIADPSGEDQFKHSFEVWEPNQENALMARFPLKRFDPEQEIPVTFCLAGKSFQTYFHGDAWLGETWKSNQVPPAEVAH